MSGGFDENDAYGRVFTFDIPYNPIPKEMNPGPGQFGITWGGQREFVDRLIRGYDAQVVPLAARELGLSDADAQRLEAALTPVQMALPFAAMSLQDCVDLAIFFIRTTMEAQRLTVGIRGVGGDDHEARGVPVHSAEAHRRGTTDLQHPARGGRTKDVGKLQPLGELDIPLPGSRRQTANYRSSNWLPSPEVGSTPLIPGTPAELPTQPTRGIEQPPMLPLFQPKR